MTISVAIVGSGPAGFYTADALLKSGAEIDIDIIERLPSPYGLIRGGVAPDHQTTKKVAKSFEKTARDERVRYYGNVEIGRALELDELRALYDAVVLAVGAPVDRPLGIPGGDKIGVLGAAAFVGWYNGHPDFRGLAPDLNCKGVAVIGNGNVAIDIARVLVKTPAEMATSDLTDYAAAAIAASPLGDVYLFGRRGAQEAKFTNVELREMGRLEICAPVVDPAQIPDQVTGEWSDRDRRLREKNLATLREFAGLDGAGKQKRVHFAFCAAPVEILGGERVEGLRLARTRVEGGRAVPTGEFFEIDCGLVLPAIGYRAAPLAGAPFDDNNGIVRHQDGRVAEGLYAAGWIKRGPTGVIGTNKPDGEMVSRQIIEDHEGGLEDHEGDGKKPGRAGLEDLLRQRRVRCVNFDEWLAIERAEIANAPEGAPRRKFTSIEDMLAELD